MGLSISNTYVTVVIVSLKSSCFYRTDFDNLWLVASLLIAERQFYQITNLFCDPISEHWTLYTPSLLEAVRE